MSAASRCPCCAAPPQESSWQINRYTAALAEGGIGIATALLDEARAPIGSLSFVISAAADRSTIPPLASLLTTAAREIEGKLRSMPARSGA